uniref:Uncharacterized protein n=1 Tax=Chelydra serpentina TaxID=8475 RepID=A0A8C3T3H4_CHESE
TADQQPFPVRRWQRGFNSCSFSYLFLMTTFTCCCRFLQCGRVSEESIAARAHSRGCSKRNKSCSVGFMSWTWPVEPSSCMA